MRKVSTEIEMKVAAALLGFLSAFVQLFLMRECFKLFGDAEWVVGLLLFCWIFLSALGSHLAISLEKFKTPYLFIFSGFLILGFAPVFAYMLLHLLAPDLMILAYPGLNLKFISLFFLILLPVCLINGILFSLISQVTQKNASVSGNYAYESAGTLVAGMLVFFGNGRRTDTSYVLIYLGMLSIITAWIVSYSRLRFSRSVLLTVISIIMLILLTRTSQQVSVGNIRTIKFSPQTSASIGVNLRSVSTIDNLEQGMHSLHILNEEILVQKNASIVNVKWNMPEWMINIEIFLHKFLVPGLIIVLFFFYFIRTLKPAGRSIFVAGFACLAMEVIVLMVSRSYFGSIYMASGIIISIFMAGMVLGYGLKFPSGWDKKKSFTRIIWILSILGVIIYLGISAQSAEMVHNYWFIIIMISGGFTVSFFTGFLFTIGVLLEKGSMGRIVALTYGADMMGSSLGALLISTLLIPIFGIQSVSMLVAMLLAITGIYLKIYL